MLVSISTAGYDQNSICFEKFDYARKVRDRVIHDPAFFPVIYQASENDDWADPKAWRRVNPNFEISISKDYLTREAERAKESPAYAAAFRRLHLNIWTEAETPFISLEDWDKCGKALPDLAGRRCFGGLDLSSTQDLTSFSLCFPPEGDGPYYLLSWGWIPEETMRKQRTSPYYQWVHQDYLEMIPGAVIEYAYIIEKITKLAEQYDIEAILFDRWGATAVYQELESRGMEMVGHGQGFKDQSQPTKELLKLVLSGKIVHGGHPVLRWCIANMVVETDAAGNLKPSRRRSTEKIDLAVSSIMALNGSEGRSEGEAGGGGKR
jgi:phage terminase large subunit-like protein